MSTILQKELLSAARERQLAEILETSPLDWHFSRLLSQWDQSPILNSRIFRHISVGLSAPTNPPARPVQ